MLNGMVMVLLLVHAGRAALKRSRGCWRNLNCECGIGRGSRYRQCWIRVRVRDEAVRVVAVALDSWILEWSVCVGSAWDRICRHFRSLRNKDHLGIMRNKDLMSMI
jgi:hypothetical protein